MHVPLLLAILVMLGFVVWGASLYWRGRIEPPQPPRHETRRERRRLHHKG